MRTRHIIFLLILQEIFFGAPPVQAWENYSGRNLVVYVRHLDDGNTLFVNESNKDDKNTFPIRFYGVGIPTARQPFGKEAHDELAKLLTPGEKLYITLVNQDKEGIVSALVQLNDHSINNRLVDEGLAWVDRSTCKAFFCRRWHIQESLAIKDRRGIWSLNMSSPPWQWGEPEPGKGTANERE